MLNSDEQSLLLQLSRQALIIAVKSKDRLLYDKRGMSENLLELGASFVTLKKQGKLRGCLGSLIAHQPLVEDVIEHTIQAAFSDLRFPPVTFEELPDIDIHISVLSPPEHLQFQSERDCIEKLRVGIDGVILEDKGRRGTFLPSVWEELPEPEQFWIHLKHKAGFTSDYWSDTMTVKRYQAQYFGESPPHGI